MILSAVYRDARYLELSDQIENNWARIQDHLKELNEKYPPGEGSAWVICGNGTPRIMSTVSDE